uniref:Cytochrome b561 domain-containing protein n=1 Tax=Aspergillus rugulosus TaxID=41736 RepID=K0DZA3_ASPRU|nr:hypothetical protein [Aspergillus rugulosus]
MKINPMLPSIFAWALPYYNASSESHDMYMSMRVTRSSVLGWTAVGTGSVMAGPLMFIIYGDPFSSEHEAPTVSVAKVAIVCYSCGKWHGVPISADAAAQPWIWAWNDFQGFDNYTEDVHLKMHEHHAEDGGWGRFYVDMARSISKDSSAPSIPPIRPGITALGVSDIPGGSSWLNPKVHIHGFLMSAAFLILYPAGIVAMRSGSSKSFKYHWIIQLLVSLFVLIGGAIGLIRAHKIDSSHHFIGLTVVVCSIIQIALGWRHHVIFVRIQRRQWASHGHLWLGRIFLLLGWTNVITGLLLTGHGWSFVSLAASLISVIALALRKQREIRPDWEGEDSPFALQPTRDDYFALAADDDDEHDFRFSSDHSTPVKIKMADADLT